jgi:hypothetical protein
MEKWTESSGRDAVLVEDLREEALREGIELQPPGVLTPADFAWADGVLGALT